MKTRKRKMTARIHAYMILIICMIFDSGLAAKAEERVLAEEAQTIYQKLQRKETVRIACLGDSIGEGTGADAGCDYMNLLRNWMQETYSCNIEMDNYSVGGTTAFLVISEAELTCSLTLSSTVCMIL